VIQKTRGGLGFFFRFSSLRFVIEKSKRRFRVSFRFSSLRFVMEKARAQQAIVNLHLDLLFNAT
jgi:hypothetical protein